MAIAYIQPEFEVVRNDSRCIACRVCERQCANEVHRFDPERGIMLCEIPRYEGISAGKVRSLLRAGDIGSVRKMVPETTYEIIQRQS